MYLNKCKIFPGVVSEFASKTNVHRKDGDHSVFSRNDDAVIARNSNRNDYVVCHCEAYFGLLDATKLTH